MSKIKEILSNLKIKDWILIFLIMFGIRYYLGYRHYYEKSLTSTIVYDDSLSIYKNKLKEEYADKTIYVSDISKLKELNSLLAQEIQNLKDNPLIVTKTDIRVDIDTVYAESESIVKNDTTYNLEWLLKDNSYYNMSGTTIVKNDFSNFTTRINNLSMQTKLTLDLLDNGDNKFRLIGKVDNPYITISNMEGVVLDPTLSSVLKNYYKLKKWSIGPSIGVSANYKGEIQPTVGFSLTYGLFQF